jgi:hypothetical protein
LFRYLDNNSHFKYFLCEENSELLQKYVFVRFRAFKDYFFQWSLFSQKEKIYSVNKGEFFMIFQEFKNFPVNLS